MGAVKRARTKKYAFMVHDALLTLCEYQKFIKSYKRMYQRSRTTGHLPRVLKAGDKSCG